MSDQMVVPEIFTAKEASALLKISVKHLYKLMAAGDVPNSKLAGKIVIRKEDLICYMNQELTDNQSHGSSLIDAERLSEKEVVERAVSAKLLEHKTRRRLGAS